jgi:hypothetical protein
VDLLHAADRRPPDGRVVAVLRERADQEIGVVVALERAVRELARRREQLSDARHGKGAEERQLERARGVERELVAGVEVDDAHMVAHRIEATDSARSATRASDRRYEGTARPGARRGDDRSDAAHPVG